MKDLRCAALWRLAMATLLAMVALGCVGCNRSKGAGNESEKVAEQKRPEDPPTPIGPGWFEDRAEASGVRFQLGHEGRTPLTVVEVVGTGCAICDFDGDGHPDLFFVGETGTVSKGKCALYRNKGDATFTDVTEGSGLDTPGFYMGCAVADFNNDGLPDLLVTGYGVIRLYRNLGHFKFQDVTKGSGLEAPSAIAWATSAACADIDHDGLVDLYIGRYVKFDSTTLQLCNYGSTKASCGPNFYDAQMGSLYHNMGNFKFKEITQQAGLDTAHGKCLGAAFADVNLDGWPDLYLGNDEMPGDLFINQQGKGFSNDAVSSGVGLSGDGAVQGAMGVDFGDYNHDGRFDLFVTTFETEPDSLYESSAGGVFTYESLKKGIAEKTRDKVGFGAKFADFNNAGWLDLAIANGHIHDNQEQVDKFGHYKQPMQLFMQENGVFVDRSREAGSGFLTPATGRGLAVGDLNNDGLLDIVMIDLEGRPRVLINRMPNPGHWIRVKLRGTHSNAMGLGARVTVTAGQQKWMAEATTGGSYLSASDSRVHFGLGAVEHVDRIEVHWPSGRTSEVSAPPISSEIEIKEP